MFNLSPAIRIFVHTQPTDLRKHFDGLHGLVTQALGHDVLTGDYFVFFNRRRQRCKILYWDRDGLVVWAKRLERGCFQLPGMRDTAPAMEIDSTTLAMILGGVDVRTAQRRRRYQAPIPPRLSVHSATAEVVTTSCLSMTAGNAQP
jgi:transposase